MASERKLTEALEHIQRAQKCMKTSFLKWSPDVGGAISEYQKAATCYKNVKALPEAVDAYVKTANLQEQANSPFHAAKSYEAAGLICKENKDMDKAIHYMGQAAHMYQMHGTPDTAALCLERAAKMVEMSHPAQAIDLYKRASDVAEIEDRPRQSAESIGKAGRLLIRIGQYEEAIKCLCKEIEYFAAVENYAMIAKVTVAVVLLRLTLGDYVAADQFYKKSTSYPLFSESEEAAAIDELLQAYDDGDEETARRVLSLPLIKYMDNAFAKLARGLVIPGGMRSGNKQQVGGAGEAEGGAESAEGGAPTQLEDDEMEGGLC